MRFALVSAVALGCAVAFAAACSGFSDSTPAPTTPDAAADAQVDSGTSSSSSGGEISDAGDAGDARDAKAPLGTACDGDAGACASGFCADGVCCDQSCTGACRQCNSAGSCVNIARLQEDTSFVNDAGVTADCTKAIAGAVCDGEGRCLRRINVPCDNDPQCLSNKCSGNSSKKCLGAPGELCTAVGECANTCSVGVCQ